MCLAFAIEGLFFIGQVMYPDLHTDPLATSFCQQNDFMCEWRDELLDFKRVMIPVVVLLMYWSLYQAFTLMQWQAKKRGYDVPRAGALVVLLCVWLVLYEGLTIVASKWGMPVWLEGVPVREILLIGYVVLCFVVLGLLQRENVTNSPHLHSALIGWLIYSLDIVASSVLALRPSLLPFHPELLLSALALGKLIAILLFTTSVNAGLRYAKH
jgi:hypothetical protein